jgi:hypothetical protein
LRTRAAVGHEDAGALGYLCTDLGGLADALISTVDRETVPPRTGSRPGAAR